MGLVLILGITVLFAATSGWMTAISAFVTCILIWLQIPHVRMWEPLASKQENQFLRRISGWQPIALILVGGLIGGAAYGWLLATVGNVVSIVLSRILFVRRHKAHVNPITPDRTAADEQFVEEYLKTHPLPHSPAVRNQ